MSDTYIQIKYNENDQEQTNKAQQLKEEFSEREPEVEVKLISHNGTFVEARLFKNERSFILLHVGDKDLETAHKRFEALKAL